MRAAVRAAEAVLDRVDADVVVGFGGYVAVPAYLAARRARLPIVVHEANARPGVANRLAARLTQHVFTASAQVRLPHARAHRHPAAAGDLQPRPAGAAAASARARSACAATRRRCWSPAARRARSRSSRGCAGARPTFAGAGVQVLHIVGPQERRGGRRPGQPPYVVVPFVEQMQLAYAAADFVLCRCGAMTCAELTAVGLPAAYVPLAAAGTASSASTPSRSSRRAAACSSTTPTLHPGLDHRRSVIPLMTDPGRLAAMSRPPPAPARATPTSSSPAPC